MFLSLWLSTGLHRHTVVYLALPSACVLNEFTVTPLPVSEQYT